MGITRDGLRTAGLLLLLGFVLYAGGLPSVARASNSYISNIEWGFDENETLYLKAHIEQSLTNAKVSLNIDGVRTVTSGVLRLVGFANLIDGQNLVAGEEVIFRFPYCGTCMWWDVSGNHTRQTLIDRLGLTVTPVSVARLTIGGQQDSADYPVTFWTGLKNWQSVHNHTQKEHQFNFSTLLANYGGYDALRFSAHEQFSNSTTTHDLPIPQNVREPFSGFLTLQNGLYTLRPVLLRSVTGETLDPNIVVNVAINDPASPPPHYRNPYLSNVRWGFDESERLYLTAHVDQSLNNAKVSLAIDDTRTVTSGVLRLEGFSYQVDGQNIVAGEDVTFRFPYCGTCMWWDRNGEHTRQTLIDQFGLSVTPASISHLAIGGWQDNTDYRFGDAESRIPVIIVPGMMGTRLNRASDDEEVWPNIEEMIKLSNDNDVYLNELKLNSSGQQVDERGMYPASVIEKESTPAGDQVFYKNLEDIFFENGYSTGTTLYTVPYDWRLDIRNELSRLNGAVQEALQHSDVGRVNIIAHSMGGLLVREYLRQVTSTSFLNKLIFAAVPQLGAPKAFKILNYGDNLGFEIPILGLDILNSNRAKEISQNMPGVYELLPSRRYVQVNGEYVKDFRSGGNGILGYDQTNQLMVSDSEDSRNWLLLNTADTFHAALDTYQPNGPQIYNFVGCQNAETIGEFRLYNNGKVDIGITNGDGTVPLTSAMNLAGGFTNYFVRSDTTGIDHTGLIKDSRTVNLIRGIIEDEIPALREGISTSTNSCFEDLPEATQETTVMFSTHSPIALHVYDLQNHHTGPLPNGDIELGIPGSAYEQIEENSFVFAPGGENYRVVIDGLAEGSFDFKTRIYEGSTLTNTITHLNVPLQDGQTEAEFNFSGINGDLKLYLYTNGDTAVDEVLNPSGVVGGIAAADGTPPSITISSPEARDYLHSELLNVHVDVLDSESGIAFQIIKFDGRILTDSTVDLFFETLGGHTLTVEAVDLLGNPASRSVDLQVIATPESIIADIERTYSLGWIDNGGIKNSLIKKIQNGAFVDFLAELEAQKEKHINDQAYELLKKDVEWLTG